MEQRQRRKVIKPGDKWEIGVNSFAFPQVVTVLSVEGGRVNYTDGTYDDRKDLRNHRYARPVLPTP